MWWKKRLQVAFDSTDRQKASDSCKTFDLRWYLVSPSLALGVTQVTQRTWSAGWRLHQRYQRI